MNYKKIAEGRFLDRPNRFIAHVEVDGKLETVHVKNTGRCRELLTPGTAVILCDCAQNVDRKTRYDLIAVYKGGLLINIDSQAPNAAAAEWLAAGRLFPPGSIIRPEYTYGDSQIDFAAFTPELSLLEVKGVTLERDGAVLFPDAPTLRGTKHLRTLAAFPGPAYALFVIQMRPVRYFAPNAETDPAFAAALRLARDTGVKLLAYDCAVTPDSMTIQDPVEIKIP